MRAGLLSELSVIGYEIFLQGENIRLRYQKPDAPPESARLLIEELRKYKNEVVSILKTNTITPTEKSQSQANMKAAWRLEIQALIDWFMTLDQPMEPFYLEAHRKIVDPIKFFSALRMDITAGPAGPRARMGTLQCDLRKLNAYLN